MVNCSPAMYEPLSFDVENAVTVGSTPSTMCMVEAGIAEWVMVPAAPTESLIVPPFRARELADTPMPPAAESDATTV